MLIKPTAVAEFDGQSFDVYDISGVSWIRGGQVCHTLGVTDRTLKRLLKTHRAEFAPDKTGIVTVPTPGGAQQARVFSPRGAALVAMLVSSPRAAAFRSWVLDTLEEKAAIPVPALPAPLTIPLDLLRPDLASVLRYRQRGFTPAETAKVMDMTANQVQKRVTALRRAGLLAAGV
jgi:hypothetical protein